MFAVVGVGVCKLPVLGHAFIPLLPEVFVVHVYVTLWFTQFL
jgi:hypothetical protein